jgi:hypothetical protein
MTDSVPMRFPVAGLDLTGPFASQRPRKLAEGVYGRTCADAVNVVAYECTADRRRGGSRPGLSRYIATRPITDQWVCQDLCSLIGAGDAVQTSQSGRVVYLTDVVQGVVYWSVVGSGTWTASTNNAAGTPPLNFDGIMLSAPNQQKNWYADSVNWVYWDPATQSTENWVASAGTLPVDSDNNTPRLIETWRGRTVLSGLLLSPQDITMSAVDDPTDFALAPVPFVVTQAVELSTGQAGVVGDTVTGMIPWSDDLLIIGGDASLKVLQGEPTDGGKMMDLTTSVGMAWGRAWCRDPFGAAYFFGSDGTVFSWGGPGSRPQPISQSIKKRLQNVNTGENVIRMGWDNQAQGFHLFITPLEAAADTEHWTWEARTGSWWPFRFKNVDHSPLSLCQVDGNSPDDRALVLGSWDGYVRRFDNDADTDDGTVIESSVVCGPINSKTLDEMLLHELQAVLDDDSGDVTYSVHVGKTAQAALSAAAVYSGTFSAGRSRTVPVRRSGHAVYVKFSSTKRWALEQIRLAVSNRGKVRQRA